MPGIIGEGGGVIVEYPIATADPVLQEMNRSIIYAGVCKIVIVNGVMSIGAKYETT